MTEHLAYAPGAKANPDSQALSSADLILNLGALQRDLRLTHLRFVEACKHFQESDPLIHGWQDAFDELINSCVELLGEVSAHALYEEAEKLSQSAKK